MISKIDTSRLDILTFPNNILSQKCENIQNISDSIRTIGKRMIQLVRSKEALGLAAPQIGLSIRMFVARKSVSVHTPIVFINPHMQIMDEEMIMDIEGCLSIPDKYFLVNRYKSVKISALNHKGEKFVADATDFWARVLQHEFDHLEGTLIKDKK